MAIFFFGIIVLDEGRRRVVSRTGHFDQSTGQTARAQDILRVNSTFCQEIRLNLATVSLNYAQRTLKTARVGITIIVTVISALHVLHAQQVEDIELISTDDGLSQGNVHDILQDKQGFLWIATGDGLNRYDGNTFKVFTNDPNDPWSISGNAVSMLFEDSAGRIWAFSGNSGINIYDKQSGRFHHIRHDPNDPTSLSDNRIMYFVEDTSGMFIAGVADVEINMFRLDDDFFKLQKPPRVVKLQLPPQKEGNQYLRTILKGIAQDAKGRIWVGGQDVIYRLDVEQNELILANEGYSIGTSLANPDGSVWACGAIQPLFYWNGNRATTVSKVFNRAYDIRIDNQNNMWLLRPDSLFGLDMTGWKPGIQIDEKSVRCFFRWSPRTSGGGFPLKSMTIDHSGMVWAGTNGNGLYKINPHSALFAHSLAGISIRQIAVLSESEYFVERYSGPWHNAEGADPVVDRLGIDLNEEDVDFVLPGHSGVYWLRYPDIIDGDFQLRRYDTRTGNSMSYAIDWMHYDFQPMIACRDSSIWMAGFNDILTHVEPVSGTVINYNIKDGNIASRASIDQRLVSRDVSTALHEDPGGTLWVGTERGITKCIRATVTGDPLRIIKYRNVPGDDNSLSYNHVMCFVDDPVDADHYLWVCTKGGGINRLNKESGAFMRLGKEDGLPDDVVYGMVTDNAGNLWGSTNKGIFCMTRTDRTEGEAPTYTFRNFSKADGLQDNEFNTGAYAKMPDGRLMFGGINGLNVFDPEEVLGEDFEPAVFITDLAINNSTVFPYDESGILKSSIETTKSITLTHQQNIITLEYASLDFRVPGLNKYRYQLVGADDTWVEAGSRRSATFLHLRPSQYTFRVQGSNSRGIWSEQIAKLDINVLPPWWLTWWAYAVYAAVFAAGIVAYMRFSINRAKLRQQLAFEKLEAGRIKELDLLKTRLFMNMTHEFRTPLTIILGMAQQVLDNPQEHFREGMDMIKRNGQNLLGLVNKMLSLSKLESGKMSLDLVQGDVIFFLRNIVESFRSYTAKKEIQLHFLPEVDRVLMDYDPDKLRQIVSNLLSNAFKFTPPTGNIYFSVRPEETSLFIRVKDTGCGIPEKHQDKIFYRFYQVDDGVTREYEGTGIGLALVSEMVKLMKGSISIESPPAGSKMGSEFKVALPIHQEAGLQTATTGDTTAPILELMVEPHITSGSVEIAPATNGLADESAAKDLVLLVEDNADVVAYVASCLSGYRLAVAENGKEGLEMAIELIPDIVISDVMMPIMDGFEFCKRLKSDERTRHIPVIMLTARADIDSKLEGLELGASAYLPKPYEKQELLLTLRNLFDLRTNLRQHYRSVAGLVEGVGTHQVPAQGQVIEDSFVIKVRDVITEHVDNFDFSVEMLAKELHLSHSQLARKLDALTGYSPNQFIRSIRLKQAQELLDDVDLSITAIAYDCGFSDPSYFSRVFKKEFGQTPVEWRSGIR